MDNIKIKNKKRQRIKKTEIPKAIKGFKAVEWVRQVRDNMYEKNKSLNMKDYVKSILE